MKKIISITGLEFIKLVKKKEFLWGLIMVLVMGSGMVYGAFKFPDSFKTSNVIAFYGNFASILLMLLAAKSLGEEFDLRTETFVFTSRSSRLQIILGKIFSIVLINMIIGLCGGILYDVAMVICKKPWTIASLLTTLGQEILVYMLYGFAIGAIAIMITCLVPNTITPFIYCIVLFWVMPGILQMISQKISILAGVMNYLIFCIADQFLMYQEWTVTNICVFIITGVLFTAFAVGIIEKKDL
ncbi:hypothetical protein SAMN04487770_1457 [Butyrivibrio sp. ob235]|uniref:ABC transporter permease n=1 Tax=Butyrivibrio sp. ob235 TaxID=1761780 RepID=UPI0008BE28CC|nr:hypothetical protein [Butyrivibrio sp. ob235]SEM54156.1 hypothetical protein SAMN04487770_1457 [Butyrivibrio sp. ob235]